MQYNKHAFLRTLDQQVRLIQSRSQAFAKNHVTVYDKTLLALTKNGNDLDNPAAIVYYVEQFIGIKIHEDVAKVTRALAEAVDARAFAVQRQEQRKPTRERYDLRIELTVLKL
jgi:hypothetical protein